MISTAGGSWFCIRSTRRTATIENHCQRDRRRRSMRPEKRRKLAQPGFSPARNCGRARKQATAKKPATRSSSKSTLFMRARSPILKWRTITTELDNFRIHVCVCLAAQNCCPQQYSTKFLCIYYRLARHHDVPAAGSQRRGRAGVTLRVDSLAWNSGSQIQSFDKEYIRNAIKRALMLRKEKKQSKDHYWN
jgi:hypothetical protein